MGVQLTAQQKYSVSLVYVKEETVGTKEAPRVEMSIRLLVLITMALSPEEAYGKAILFYEKQSAGLKLATKVVIPIEENANSDNLN